MLLFLFDLMRESSLFVALFEHWHFEFMNNWVECNVVCVKGYGPQSMEEKQRLFNY